MKRILCMLAGALSLHAWSADEVTPFELGCEMRQWTIDDGLPSNVVRELAQTPDGYIWVGCPNGLARFDGTKFTRLSVPDSKSPEVHVADFWVDEAGNLWVYDSRGRLLKRNGEGLRVVAEGKGIPATPFVSLFTAGEKVMWISLSDSELTLWQYSQQQAERLSGPIPAPVMYPGPAVVTGDGAVWAALFFDSEGWLSARDGRLERLPVSSTLGRVFHVFRGLGGHARMFSEKGLAEYAGGEWRVNEPMELSIDLSVNIDHAVQDHFGRLWIGTQRGGLWVKKPGEDARHVRCYPERSSRAMSNVMLAKDGSIYAAGRGGLFRFQPSPVLKWPANEDVRYSDIATISESGDGTMWFAGPDGVLCLPKGGGVRQVADPAVGKILNQVEGAENGGVWLSDFSSNLWHGNEGGWQRTIGVRGKALSGTGFIGGLVDTGEGTLWISGRNGLQRFHKGRFESVQLDGADPKAKVEIIAHGSTRGELLAGLSDGSVMRWQKDAWETLVESGSGGAVDRLACAPDGTLWYARDGRWLGCWREGRWGDLPPGLMKAPDGFSIAADDIGGLWLAIEEAGVWRLDAAEVAAHCFGEGDGPLSIFRLDEFPDLISRGVSGRNTAIYRSTDGRIWVAGVRGVSAIDPVAFTEELERSVSPPVKIETLQAGSRIAWEKDRSTGGAVTIQPMEDRFELHFAVLRSGALASPTLRCRLAGYEQDFHATGSTREIAYSGVRPGRYTFQLESLDSKGAPAHHDELELVVLAHWWEQRVVQMAALALVVALLAYAVGRKIKNLRQAGERRAEVARRILEAEERERKRVASELHDGLGQNLLVMKNLASLAGRSLPAENAAVAQFKEIADAAGQALAEVRSISRALRPPELDRLGLTKAVRAMANRVAESTDAHVECDLPEVKYDLTPEHKIGVFRILQEALNNALRHSGADRVTITLHGESQSLTATVEDNGHGFPSTDVAVPGIGLQSMRERASLMGGRLEIVSQQGEGTRVQLTVPLGGAQGTTHS
ncbi:MAG: histidine kinase [Prosthecobacter sp.]